MAKRRKGEAPDNVALVTEDRAPDSAHDSSREYSAPGMDAADEAIAARAYEIYRERGGEHGRALDDWLQAERELAERRGQRR